MGSVGYMGSVGLASLSLDLTLTLALPPLSDSPPPAACLPPPPPQPAHRRAMEDESSQDSSVQYMNLSDDEATHFRVSCRARVRVGLSDLGFGGI